MVDFVAHQSSAGYKVPLDTGPTGPTSLSRCQAASECLSPPPLPAGTPAEDGDFMGEDSSLTMGNTHFQTGE